MGRPCVRDTDGNNNRGCKGLERTFTGDMTIVVILLQICAAIKHSLRKVVRMVPSRQLRLTEASRFSRTLVGIGAYSNGVCPDGRAAARLCWASDTRRRKHQHRAHSERAWRRPSSLPMYACYSSVSCSISLSRLDWALKACMSSKVKTLAVTQGCRLH